MNLVAHLGTEFPLIQAPMAGAQDARLAIAAGAAGALGSLPAAMLDAATLHRELCRLQDGGHPYNVNFFSHRPPVPNSKVQASWRAALAPYYAELGIDPSIPLASADRRPFGDELAEVLESFRPAVVSFHFGLPAPELLARVKVRGSMVLSSATTVAEARWLQSHGADAVIAQGLEAGGHRGHFISTDVARQASTSILVREMVEAIDIPVIAAGGIASAAGVREAMRLGASGIQVGTAFLLCTEATTGPLHRARLKDVSAETALTNLFTGGLARGLVNRAMRELGPTSKVAPPFPMASAAIGPIRAKFETMGLDCFTSLWSGTDRSGCREAPAAEVVAALVPGFSA
jgi:nitronate monooxygenase